jgi:hypothetical protein
VIATEDDAKAGVLQLDGVEAAKATVPLKRLTETTWMVEVPDVPATRERPDGEA